MAARRQLAVVCTTLGDSVAAIRELEAALIFYSNDRNYIDGICEEGTTKIDDDCGAIARAALLAAHPAPKE